MASSPWQGSRVVFYLHSQTLVCSGFFFRVCTVSLWIEAAFTHISEITEMLPDILNQLGTESLVHLKKLADYAANQFNINGKDDVPGE